MLQITEDFRTDDVRSMAFTRLFACETTTMLLARMRYV